MQPIARQQSVNRAYPVPYRRTREVDCPRQLAVKMRLDLLDGGLRQSVRA